MKQDKRKLRYLMCLLLCLQLWLTDLCLPEAAAVGLNNSLKVRQIISINSDYSKPHEVFNYALSPSKESPTAPLPENARQEYIFSLYGDEERSLDLRFSQVGTYVYELRQLPSDNKYVQQDFSVYTITIRVVNTVGGLKAEVSMILNQDKQKIDQEKLTYRNHYEMPNPGGSGSIGDNEDNSTDKQEPAIQSIAKKIGLLSKTGNIRSVYEYVGVVLIISGLFLFLLYRKREAEAHKVDD